MAPQTLIEGSGNSSALESIKERLALALIDISGSGELGDWWETADRIVEALGITVVDTDTIYDSQAYPLNVDVESLALFSLNALEIADE